MTFNMQWEKRLIFSVLVPLFGICSIILTVCAFHVTPIKCLIFASCGYFSCYFFSVVAMSISIEDDEMSFCKLIGKKQLSISKIQSIGRNWFLGVIIFKTSNTTIWVLKDFPKLGEVIELIRIKKPSIAVDERIARTQQSKQ